MQSNRELIREEDMGPIRNRIGINLQQINPKIINDDSMSFESSIDFASVSSSVKDLPKFATIQNLPSQQINNANSQTQILFERIFRNKQKKYEVYNQQTSDRNLVYFAKIFIWWCYLLGTSQTDYTSINGYHIVDFAGLLIAAILVFRKVGILKRCLEFDDILHLMSIILTVALFTYQSNSINDPFLSVLQVIRSLRLFFPMNYKYSFKDLTLKYSHKIKRIFKVSIPLFITLIIFSVVFSQGMYEKMGNRCRFQYSFNQSFPKPLDCMLCGARTCNQNIFCLNPMKYDIVLDKSEYQMDISLAFGFFTYQDLSRSIFTSFSIGTLSHSSKIIQIYLNSSPTFVVIGFNLLLIILFQLYLMPSLLVLFQERMNQSHLNALLQECQKEIPSVEIKSPNQSGLGEATSVIAATFGPNSSNNIHRQNQNISQIKLPIDVTGSFELKQPADLSNKNSKYKIGRTMTNEANIMKTKFNKCQIWKCLALWFTILMCGIHFALATTFTLGNLSLDKKASVGLVLGVIFIVWSFFILMKLYSVYCGEQQQEQQKRQFLITIIKTEVFIYLSHLLDYIVRIYIGVYILQQSSPMTPVSSSLLILRIVYIPLISSAYLFENNILKNFNKQLTLFFNITSSMFPYVLVMFIVSTVMATLAFQFSTQGGFILAVVKYFTIITNNNWIEQYQNVSYRSNLDNSGGLGFIIKFVLIVMGEIIFLRIIFSEGIMLSYRYSTKSEISFQTCQQSSTLQKLDIIKKQKSLYFLSFQFLQIRETLYTFLHKQGYQTNKQRFIIIYIITSIAGYILIKDSAFYEPIVLVLDSILVLDTILNIVVFRLWGEASFINYKWYNVLNLVCTVVIIINFRLIFMDSFVLRVFRIYLLIPFIPSLSQSYELIKMATLVLSKTFTLFMVLWVILSSLLSMTTSQITNSNSFLPLITSMAETTRLFSKGYDLLTPMSEAYKDNTGFFKIQNSIFYLFISIPFQCLCVGMLINFLKMKKQSDENVEIGKIFEQKKCSYEQGKEQLQNNKIRQKILSLTPEFNPQAYLQAGYFFTLFSSKKYKNIKFVIQIVSAALLLLVYFCNTHISPFQLLQLKLAKFYFLLLQILLFITELIIFQGKIRNYKYILIMFLVSFPGMVVMIVPHHKVSASSQLKNVLQILLILGPLHLLQLYYIFRSGSLQIIHFVFSKIRITIWIFIWLLIFSLLISASLTSFLNKNFITIFGSITIGLFGGTYEIFLQSKQSNQVILHIIELITFVIGLITRNFLMAFFIFETMQDIICLKKTNSKASLSEITSFFDEQRFMNIWNHLDSKAAGVLSFKVVLNNISKFARCFQLYNVYLQFLLCPQGESYFLKLFLFRRLHLPVRSVIIVDKQHDHEHSEYMVTIYDVVSRFICLALNQRRVVTQQQQISDLIDPIIDWAPKLGFDDQDWCGKQIKMMGELNKIRKQQWECSENFSIQKRVECDSWSLGSVLRIFPAMRTRISSMKEKLKQS